MTKTGAKDAGKVARSSAGKKSSPSKRRKKSQPVAAEIVDDKTGVDTPYRDVEVVEEASPSLDRFREELSAVGGAEIDPDRDEWEDSVKLANRSAPRSSTAAGASQALTTNDPVLSYLAEIRKYALLTREQEQELAKRYYDEKDPRAAELLVTSNLRFVVKIAAEYSRFGAKLIDLIQEGNVGLMHAVREFNPYKGVRLITYAVWWIRGYIQEYLMRQYSMVRIGTTQNQRKLFYRLQKERDAIARMGQEPEVKLLAGRLGVSEEEVETMSRRLSGRDVSLNQPIGGDESAPSLLDFEASGDVSADEALGHHEELELLHDNLDKIKPHLNERELYLLENRLLADDPQTLQEVGEHFGVTREAVRQLEVRLLGKIRQAMAEDLRR